MKNKIQTLVFGPIKHFINSKFTENEHINDSSCQHKSVDFCSGDILVNETFTSSDINPVVVKSIIRIVR